MLPVSPSGLATTGARLGKFTFSHIVSVLIVFNADFNIKSQDVRHWFIASLGPVTALQHGRYNNTHKISYKWYGYGSTASHACFGVFKSIRCHGSNCLFNKVENNSHLQIKNLISMHPICYPLIYKCLLWCGFLCGFPFRWGFLCGLCWWCPLCPDQGFLATCRRFL